MGCGSSKSAVAVVENNNRTDNTVLKKPEPKKTQSLDHFQVQSSNNSLQKTKTTNSQPPSTNGSLSSLTDSNNNKNKLNLSKKSLHDEDIRKPSTASSSKSGDSGVYDDNDRLSSATSRKSGKKEYAYTKAISNVIFIKIQCSKFSFIIHIFSNFKTTFWKEDIC